MGDGAGPAGDDLNATVVVPVRNEGEAFARTYRELGRVISPDTRIVVVYDAPDDTTVPTIEVLARDDPRVHGLLNRTGPGIPSAFRAAFAHVPDGPVIVVMGDLSDDLALIPEMVRRWSAGAGVVCPSRYMPGGAQHGGPRLKGLLARLCGLTLYWLGALPVRDATNNFRLYDGAFLRRTPIESRRGFEVALELTVKAHRAGLRVEELPTVWTDRRWGTSNFPLMRSLPHYLRWWWYAATGWRPPA